MPFLTLPRWLPAGEAPARKPSQPSGSEVQAPSTGARSDPVPCSLQPRVPPTETTLAPASPQAAEGKTRGPGGVEIGMQRTLGETGGEKHCLLRENCSPATAGPVHQTQTGSSDFSIPGGVQARPEAGGTRRSSLHPAVRTPHQASSLHRAPKATPSCSWGTITVAVWPQSLSSPPHLPLL